VSGAHRALVRKFAVPLALCLAIGAVYGVALKAPFIFDDEVMVVSNRLITSPAHLGEIWTTSAMGVALAQDRSYRPLQITSYLLDYRLWGLNPAGYHALSLLIHTASALLLYALLLQFDFSVPASGIAATVFGVHPVNIEAVTYVSGRGDALFLLLALVAFNAFILGLKRHPWAYLVAVAAYALALLAKENAISLPFLVAAYAYLVRREPEPGENAAVARQATATVAGLFAVLAVYLGCRYGLLPHSGSGTFSAIGVAPFWQRLASVPWIVWTYLRLMIAPFPLHMEYHYVADSFWNRYLLAYLPAALLLLVALSRVIRRRAWYLFGLFWFFASLGPVYQVPFPLAATLREHWLYLPQIGLLIVLALAIDQVIRERPALVTPLYLLLAAAVAALGAVTVVRNREWLDPVRFYEADISREGRSSLLYNNLGREYAIRGDDDRALAAFLAAIEVSPRRQDGLAHYNAGLVYDRHKQWNEALGHYLQSIAYFQYPPAYAKAGAIYLRQRRYEDAIALLQDGLAKYPGNAEARYRLGLAYFSGGRLAEADRVLLELKNSGASDPMVDSLLAEIRNRLPANQR
jgi:tetratricopeptide (TPR) repeat protein